MAYKEKKCPICGDIFVPTANRQSICQDCRLRECKYCGQIFRLNDVTRAGTNWYCSSRCEKAARWGGTGSGIRICEFCGSEFLCGNNSRRYCSPKCAQLIRRRAIGATRIRLVDADKKYPQRMIKTAQPNTWQPYSHWLWESVYGPIPRGHLIHHIDGDRLNDSIDNLSCITRIEHGKIHAKRQGFGGNTRWHNSK